MKKDTQKRFIVFTNKSDRVLILHCLLILSLVSLCSCSGKKHENMVEHEDKEIEESIGTNKADKRYVKNIVGEDGYKYNLYENNQDGNSTKIAIVDSQGNFLSKIYSNSCYDSYLFNDFGSYFVIRKSFKNTSFATCLSREGKEMVPLEFLYRVFSTCHYKNGSESKKQLHWFKSTRYVNPFRGEDYSSGGEYIKSGLLDENFKEVLMPIYDRVDIEDKLSTDDTSRFLVRYKNRWFTTDYYLDDEGHVLKCGTPFKKGFYRLIENHKSYASELNIEYEILFYKNFAVISVTPQEEPLPTIWKCKLFRNEDGIRYYMIRDTGRVKYFMLDGDIVYSVFDYVDEEDGPFYQKTELTDISSNYYQDLENYEHQYHEYFNEISLKIGVKGSMSFEELYNYNQGMPKEIYRKIYGGNSSGGSANIHSSPQLNMSSGNNYASPSNNYDNSSNNYQQQQTRQRVWHECSRCRGKGTIVHDSYSSTYGYDDPMIYCQECGRSWHQSSGHRHITCPQCGGNRGWYSE